MTPQSTFMIAAPIRPGQVAAVRALLATMTTRPGMADPRNALVPFERFANLHVARLVVIEDPTLPDLITAEGAVLAHAITDAPVYLMFLGDCDGPREAMFSALIATCEPALRQIFAHCVGFTATTDLRLWMRASNLQPATQYTNWVGRTVLQIREEAALHSALQGQLRARAASSGAAGSASGNNATAEAPQALRSALRKAIALQGLQLSPPAPTPLLWRIGQTLHLLFGLLVVAAGILALPVLLIPLLLALWRLRALEKTDRVIAPRPSTAVSRALEAVEDHDVTNAFSAVGSRKTGWFRLVLISIVLWGLNFTARHWYTRGHLARVGTIHFARWVFLDSKRRLLFASNYDGGLETYMDDFINKAGFGLNLVFSNGYGYPRTNYLLADGAQDEMSFKHFLRRHQVPTDVWYKAYPGLTTFDLLRNTKIRTGFERASMSDAETRQWLALI